MELITGGAHASENNTTKGSAGDSKQKSVPDFDGEVSFEKGQTYYGSLHVEDYAGGYTFYEFSFTY